MPTYEYECAKCGVFEISQRMSAKALTKCPTCKRKVQRLISASSFAFKGTGWYVTDYARKGAGKSDGGEGSSSGEGASSTASDSKTTDSKATDSKAKPKTEAAKPASTTTEKPSS